VAKWKEWLQMVSSEQGKKWNELTSLENSNWPCVGAFEAAIQWTYVMCLNIKEGE
jgi:hypothetical protein